MIFLIPMAIVGYKVYRERMRQAGEKETKSGHDDFESDRTNVSAISSTEEGSEDSSEGIQSSSVVATSCDGGCSSLHPVEGTTKHCFAQQASGDYL